MEIGPFYFLKKSSILLSLELSRDVIFSQGQVREMTVNDCKLIVMLYPLLSEEGCHL